MTIRFFDWTKRCYHILLPSGMPNRFAFNGSLAAATAIPVTDALTFKDLGDATHGFSVAILRNREPIARHNQGGEFSATFQNEDRSVEDRVEDWKASAWTGDPTRVALSGECKLRNLNATVFVQVEYERITPRIFPKSIPLRQSPI